ncbi:unnamed protein product [Moneuplotes crassus]|uniref:Glutaredoxin domain-containing protein n=1 Tax=Euplotes crassus TaxID=5936 RepID=A0AAD1Y4Y4_EUPCR|nr:unnamed protein product [Moneuplotes crassus]
MDSTFETILSTHKVAVFSKGWCPFCQRVIASLTDAGISHEVIDLDDHPEGSQISTDLRGKVGRTSVPQVFVGGELVGGCDDTLAGMSDGSLKTLLDTHGVAHGL